MKLEKDFEELISLRCEKAVEECSEYMDKEYSGLSQEELQPIAEKLCYKRGFADAVAILMHSHDTAKIYSH